MPTRYDILIIGGGNAGFGVSSVAAKAGKRIAFAEARDFGGTCPNRGCTPKKILVAAAHALHEIERAKVHGIEVGEPRLDWGRLIDRVQTMIAPLPDSMEKLAHKRGDVVRGAARFVAGNAVAVGDSVLEAEHIVIATGSKPRPLSLPGAGHLITSEQVLSERERPDEVVFIGGGVIAMEFSHVYARAGAKVTILELMPQVLSGLDPDAVTQIRNESERIGITVHTEVEVKELTHTGERLRVRYVHEAREATIDADRVINGAGRIANVDALDLDAGGVRHDGIRIEVDACLRSVSNPSVWVCGDALVGSPQLSPLATYEGQLVGRNIVNGSNEQPDYRTVPSCVFTVPALASVGLSSPQAEEQGLDVSVAINDMSEWLSARTYGESTAWSKVLVDNASGQIVGAHLIGHHAEDLIHLFALAMKHGISTVELEDSLFAFPTFSADVKNLL